MEYLTLAKGGRVERRTCARLAVSSLIFVKLGDGNGGIAFNISEEGLALSAANGLPESQIPELTIQLPDSGDWIRVSGQIQWRSNSNKECGVRLVGMDETVRSRIREFIDAEISSADLIPGTESTSVFPDVKLNGAAPTPGDYPVVSAAKKEDKEEKREEKQEQENDALEATPGAPDVPPAAEHAGQSMLPQAQPESESTVVIDASIAPKEVVRDRRTPPAVVSPVDPYCVEAMVDRRIYPRKRIIPLGYVQLGEMNGGVSLNVSEGGLSLTTAHVLLADHLPSIRLQLPDNTEWLDVKGEIVWRSESKKEAGVRFVDLPEEARLRLRKWLSSPVPPTREGEGEGEEEEEEETQRSLKPLSAPEFLSPCPTSDSSPTDETPDRAPESFPPPVRETSLDHSNLSGAPSISQSQSVKLDSGVIRIRINRTGWKKAGMLSLACTITVTLLGLVGLSPVIRDRLSSRLQGTKRTIEVVIPKPVGTETAQVVPQSPPVNVANASQPQPPDGLQELARKRELPENSATVSKPNIPWKDSPLRVQGPQLSFRAETAHDPVRSLPGTPAQNHGAIESLTAYLPLTNPTLPREEPRAASAPPEPLVQKEVRLAPPMPFVSPPANAEVTGSGNNSTKNGGEAASLPRTESAVRINGTVAIATDPYPSIRFAGSPKGNKSRHAASLRLGQLVSHVEPPYPAEALEKGIQGTVRIHVIVSPEGSIGRVVSVEGPPLLVPATIRAVQQWRYSQTLLAGRPVETEDNIAVTFGVSTGINR